MVFTDQVGQPAVWAGCLGQSSRDGVESVSPTGLVTLGGWEVAAGRQEQITVLETKLDHFLPCYIIKFVIFILILSSSE